MKKAIALGAILVVAGALFAQTTDKFISDFQKAEGLLTQKNYKQAYDLYNSLTRDAETRGFAAEVKYRTAQCAYQLGRFEVAIALLEKVLNVDIPADSRYVYLVPQVKFSLGLCYFQIGDDQRAERYLDEAAELGGMGIADYLMREDYKIAIDHLKEILKERNYPVDKLFLARSEINSRNTAYFSEILSILTELSEDVTLEELVDFSRPEMQFYNQDYTTAKAGFRDFLTRYPQSPLRNFVEYYLGCTYYHDKEYRYSVDLLGKLTDPNKSGYVLAAHAYFMMGEAYDSLKLSDSAMFSYEMARTVAPNSMVDFYTTYRLYQIHREEGNLDFARREATRMKDIALTGRNQKLMEDLSWLVRGNIEFDQPNYPQATNYYQQVTIGVPPLDASPEELLIYEATMTMQLLALNRENTKESFNVAMTTPQGYLGSFRDSIPIKYGAEWRAYLLYNQADATYYSAYTAGGDVTTANKKRLEEARGVYQTILDKYPDSDIARLARVSLTWYKLEAKHYDEALDEFKNIVESTLNKDAMVLAAYGAGLATHYKALSAPDSGPGAITPEQRKQYYTEASSWFFNEDDYKNQLGVVIRRQDVEGKLKYNEIADSLIDRSLYWRARSLEGAKFYGDALAVYEHIKDTYPDRSTAGEAWSKIIEFNILAQKVDDASNAVEELKGKRARYPQITSYKDAYGFGLASLFDYYQMKGDEATALEYATRIDRELGTTKPYEQVYYMQAVRDTTVEQIADLRDKIEKIRTRNSTSEFLPQLLYNLSWLLIQDKNYDEAEKVLVELSNWPDAEATKDFMPRVDFQLGQVFVAKESYGDAKIKFEDWVRKYEKDETQTDLAPFVFFNLGLAYFSLGEDAERQGKPQIARDNYRNAMSTFQKIKDNYKESDFYKTNGPRVDDLIRQCRLKLG